MRACRCGGRRSRVESRSCGASRQTCIIGVVRIAHVLEQLAIRLAFERRTGCEWKRGAARDPALGGTDLGPTIGNCLCLGAIESNSRPRAAGFTVMTRLFANNNQPSTACNTHTSKHSSALRNRPTGDSSTGCRQASNLPPYRSPRTALAVISIKSRSQHLGRRPRRALDPNRSMP